MRNNVLEHFMRLAKEYDHTISFKINVCMAIAQGLGVGIGLGLATDVLVMLLFKIGVLK